MPHNVVCCTATHIEVRHQVKSSKLREEVQNLAKLEAPVSELLLDTDAAPSDGLELFVFGNEGGWNARLIARLDNLGKGASGAAVQNLNLMCGLPETAGLILPKN